MTTKLVPTRRGNIAISVLGGAAFAALIFISGVLETVL